MRHWMWGLFLALSLNWLGCGGADSKSQGVNSSPAVTKSSVALKRYAAAELPPVADPLPTLDDGRVELAPPKGWRTLSRDNRYLVRLVRGEGDNSLPRLTAKAEPAPEGIADVTEENAGEFSAQVEKLSAAVSGRKLIEPERPIIVGDVIWSRHVRHLRARSSNSGHAAVQSLATVRGGRMYTVELTVESASDADADFAKAILAERDAAYALAAHWKFTGEAAEPIVAPPVKESAEDATAQGESTESIAAPAESAPEKNPE